MNKTISINPSLFSIGSSSRTKKNRDRKSHPKNIPLISPNVLKNKLLKRIKEHKVKETENQENNRKKLSDTTVPKSNLVDVENYNDEFNDSLNYLQTLSIQTKNDETRTNLEKNKQRRQEELNKATIKNYTSLLGGGSQKLPFVNIDLPEELKEPFINIENSSSLAVNNQTPLILTPYKTHDVPYGILKGGIKPTYRDWNKTQRNLTIANPSSCITIDGNINRQQTERETRLNILKNNIKEKNMSVVQKISVPKQTSILPSNEDIMMTTPLIHKPTLDNVQHVTTDNKMSDTNVNHSDNISPIKRSIKKTIRRKYTLGKSKIKKTVGVLLKDRGTRKVIISAQRDLKKKQINEVKSYLRHHNLIKIGCNAPNDVIRKLYESAMLAGEITNVNSEYLLHNLMKEEKEM